MIINNITDLLTANEVIIQPLFKNEHTLLPVDQFTHACIINERIDFLRLVTEATRTYDEYIAEYIEQTGILDNDHSNYGITVFPEISQMVYPFSKTQFFKTFYPNVVPSVANLYFTYMKNTGRIIQIGSGVGKALIIKPVNFTEEDFIAIKSLNVPYSALAQLLIQATDHLAKQEADIKFLLDKVLVAEKSAESMRSKLIETESLLINTTMTTWR